MIEPDPKRRQQYWNARAYFSVTNNTAGEMLAEIAVRRRDVLLGKTQDVASRNLEHLDRFMAEHREVLGWVRPRGGVTAFPWLVSGGDARGFCKLAAAGGVLLVPGDCFDMPSHFRLGFAASGEEFPKALDRLRQIVKSWVAKSVAA